MCTCRDENCSTSLRCATSFFATTIKPLVSLSSRCTIPGRNSPPISLSWLKRNSSAFTSVPRLRASSALPELACTTIPAGLFTTASSLSSNTTSMRNVLGKGLQRSRLHRPGNLDHLAALQLQRSLGRALVHQHLALLHQLLHPNPAHVRNPRHQKVVQAQPGVFLRRIKNGGCQVFFV